MVNQNFSIKYDKTNNIVYKTIINENIPLNNISLVKDSIASTKEIMLKQNCYKLFDDYSLIDIKMSYDQEYYYAKNFKSIFDYPEGTYIAVYLGNYYDKKRWDLFRSVLKENEVYNIEYFGNEEKALNWLKSK